MILVKSDGSEIENAEPNTGGCVNKLLHSMLSSLSVSLNGKEDNFQETNYYYKTYNEMHLNPKTTVVMPND
jgi:hypothetical protein